jgi:hypothetical protein
MNIINRILGDVYLQARRYDEAITQSRKAIEIEPNFPSAHEDLGRTIADGVPRRQCHGPRVGPREALRRLS